MRVDDVSIFCSPFFQLNCYFHGQRATVISQPTDRFLPLRQCRPHEYINIERRCQKNGEKPLCFYDSSVISLTFFQLNCCFGENAWSVISQLTDGFLPCHRRRPLALIKTEQLRKNNGKKPLRFDDFTSLLLTFFQLNCYFRGKRVFCDIAAHIQIFIPPPPSPARVY